MSFVPYPMKSLAAYNCLPRPKNFVWIETISRKNVDTAFGSLRDKRDFTDVTQVCEDEDGQQMQPHKVICRLYIV